MTFAESSKVPYIASLGVDYVWFSPFFPSPQRDNGYDISDYCDIDPAMGTDGGLHDELVGSRTPRHRRDA